jgi:hypothetical protein
MTGGARLAGRERRGESGVGLVPGCGPSGLLALSFFSFFCFLFLLFLISVLDF